MFPVGTWIPQEVICELHYKSENVFIWNGAPIAPTQTENFNDNLSLEMRRTVCVIVHKK